MSNNDSYKKLADENLKHIKSIDETLIAIKDNLNEIRKTHESINSILIKNTSAIESIEKYWGNIVKILVIAIAVLAGAEKVLKVLNI